MESSKQEMELFLFSHFQALIKKLLIHINQGVQNWGSRQKMELSKQKMELFLPLSGLWLKNVFYKVYLFFTKEFKIHFQNRKWNYFTHL